MSDRASPPRPPWPAIALAATVALALYAAAREFAPISLGEVSVNDLGTLFAGLFFVALVIERAVEVYVGNLFDAEEARLVTPQRQQQAVLEGVSQALDNEAGRLRGASSEAREAIAAEGALEKLRRDADAARQSLDELRTAAADDLVALKSRKASAAATVLGAASAAVGMRVLEGIAPATLIETLATDSPGQLFWLRAVDVALTALLLAGGADGIHRVLGDFLKRRKDFAATAA